MRSHWIGVATTAAFVSCSDLPTMPGPMAVASTPVTATSAADVTRGNSVQSFTGLTTSCEGELVLLNWTIENRWHTTLLPSGHWQRNQQTVIRSRGAGLSSGNRYEGRGVVNSLQVYAVPDGGAFTYQQVVRMHGIVQGSADNDFFLIHAKWTINAEGTVVVEFFNVDWQCRG